MKLRFEPDAEPNAGPPPPRLIDPEAYDASEQQFAASLDVPAVKARFVVDDGTGALTSESGVLGDAPSCRAQDVVAAQHSESVAVSRSGEVCEPDSAARLSPGKGLPQLTDPVSWRREVTAKIQHYRTHKRPRVPRYPSLQLRFEALDSAATARVLPIPETEGVEEPKPTSLADLRDDPHWREELPTPAAVAPAGKILEFPILSPPPIAADELAGPVFDRPRILEAPEVVPPPPALGGILIEPAEEPTPERRQGFEMPLLAAPFSRRILAAATDVLIVVSSFALFAYTFFKITSLMPPLPQTASISVTLLALFWAGYEYLLLAHAGTTPGLKLAKLRLTRFDGTCAPRELRRWRVLASLLSGLSLGLGYAWCFLDEDRLCWHDRITHTYMAPDGSSNT